MEIDRRVRPPWRPQRGERVRLPGTGLSVPELAGFAVVVFVVVMLLTVALIG